MSSSLENSRVENSMLDLETTGTFAGCGILTIGACTFDLRERFYERIDPASSRQYLLEEQDTMRWWAKQDPQIREEAFGGTRTLISVLDDFHDWFRSLNNRDYKHTLIWGNSALFDCGILAAAYHAVDRPLPWEGKNERCYRTLKKLLPTVQPAPRATKAHHALNDAIYQAEHATVLLQVL